MQRTSVMVVGDTAFRSTLAEDIQAGTGLLVTGAADSKAVRAVFQSRSADILLAVLDAELPDGEALRLCAELSQGARSVPVIIAADARDEGAVLRSLEAGAVDHVSRTHHRAELLARVRAHLRSLSTSLDAEITLGPFTFRPGQRALIDRRTQARIWLTAKETRLLRRLHLANGKPTPAAALIDAAWNSADTSMHTLHTHVYRLRTKLGLGSSGGVSLQTARDGYMLVI